MSRSVAIVDLDHGLLTTAPGPLVADALARPVEFAEVAHRIVDLLAAPFIGEVTARAIARSLAGTSAEDLLHAGEDAAARIPGLVAPHAEPLLEEHRNAGRRLVLTTHLPRQAAEPIARALGFDALIATDLEQNNGHITGHLAGPVVWGRGKLDAARGWAKENGASLRRSYAYAGSIHDAPLLAEVGNPVVTDPDPALAGLAWLKGWPTRSLRAPSGVLKIAGVEIQDVLRPFARPELMPFARFEFEDLEHIPSEGPVIVAFNHRSYFDASAVALATAKRGRSVRGLGKKEVFDVPVFGALARWLGGIRVERGSGSDEPLNAAADALRAGDLIMIAPEGTIPRGPAFFEPELKGRWGAARLAAMTRAPVVPLGLWGTEKAWPRNSRLPRMDPRNRPLVQVKAGPPVALGYQDPDADTKAIMSAIVDVLPPEARIKHIPTEEELALTYPAGYKGDPDKEAARRPGSDT